MNISEDILYFVAQYGLILAAMLSAVVLLSWRLDPEIWVYDLTKGAKKGNTKGYRSTLILMIVVLTGFMVHADTQVIDLNPQISQSSLFVLNILMLGMYALVKFFLIDYLIYSKIKPGFMKIDDVPFETNIFFHLRLLVLNMLYGGVFCYLAAIISINLAIY